MLDPVSLIAITSTFLSSETGKNVISYTTSKLAETALGGYIGNRADYYACKLFSNVFGKVKNLWTKDELPQNTDLAKAVREANLYATQFLIYAVTKEWHEQYEKTGDAPFKKQEKELKKAFEKYLRDQKDALETSYPDRHSDPAYGKIERLLEASESNGETIQQIRQQLIKEVKDNLVVELQTGLNMPELPKLLVNNLYNGWNQEGKVLDWFDIMTLKFSDILKDPTNEKAQKAFTNRLLSDLKIDTETIRIDVKEILQKMDTLIPLQNFITEQWLVVERWLDELNIYIEQIKSSTGKIEAQLDILIAGQSDSKARAIFKNSQLVLQLVDTIEKLKQEVENNYIKYNKRKKAYDDEPDEDKQELLELANTNWLKMAKKLQNAEKELTEIKKFVFETYDWFSKQDMSAASEINKLAKDYFEKGEFDKVKNLLSSEEREAQRQKLLKQDEQILTQKKEFAIGDVFNAKALLVDFKDADRFNKAIRYFEKSLAIYTYYSNCFEYAYFLATQDQTNEAIKPNEPIKLYKLALSFLKSDEIESRARTLNNLGNLLRKINDPTAYDHLQEALDLRRQLVKLDSAAYLPDVATTLDNFGILLSANNNPAAQTHFEEALAIRMQLAEQNPATYLPFVTMTLNNLGNFLEQNNDPAARAYLQESLAIRRQLAEQNPSLYLPYLAMALHKMGSLLSKKKEPEAQTHLQEALSIRRPLVAQNPEAYLPDIADTHNSLGCFLTQSNDPSAQTHFEQALDIYSRLAARNPAAYLPNSAIMHDNLGKFLNKNDAVNAQFHYQKALDIRRQLADRNPNRFTIELLHTANNFAKLLEEQNKNELLIDLYDEILGCLLFLAQKQQANISNIKYLLNISNKRCQLLLNKSEFKEAFKQIILSVRFIYFFKEVFDLNEDINETNRLAAHFNTDIQTIWEDDIQPLL